MRPTSGATPSSGKELAIRDDAHHPLRAVAGLEQSRRQLVARETLERHALLAECLQVGSRDGAGVAHASDLGHLHEPIGRGEWQRPQKHGVDDAEDGRRRAGGQRQRGDRQDREARTAEKGARREPQIALEVIEPHQTPDLARFLAQAKGVPESRRRGQHRAMRFHLAPQFVVMTAAVEQVREPAEPLGDSIHLVTWATPSRGRS